MSENELSDMRPQKAQAYGRPEAGGFLVRKGSTAMREGYPRLKRDHEERGENGLIDAECRDLSHVCTQPRCRAHQFLGNRA